jgi:predicted nucleic acid-binding protein
MVLVDSSVIIDFLQGKYNPHTNKLEEIHNNKIPFGINSWIFQEVLQGVSDSKQFNLLKEYLLSLQLFPVNDEWAFHEAAARIYSKCRKMGITIRSTIDCCNAQTAIENKLYLLHNDNDYVNMKKVIPELKFY